MAWREVGTTPSTTTTGSFEGLGQGGWRAAGRSEARRALVETGKILVKDVMDFGSFWGMK